jgi:hypothetical protein
MGGEFRISDFRSGKEGSREFEISGFEISKAARTGPELEI